jgi:hypothetical protein
MTAFGQLIEPLGLAKKIFTKEPFPDIENYVAGEYKGRPNGQDLQRGAISRFLLLAQSSNKAVVAMTVLDSNGKGLDTYLHFEKDSIWKMIAFRTLAMTGMIEQVKNELEKMTPDQVEVAIEKSEKTKGKQRVGFASREDYDYELGNATLILELDENIIAHFRKNEAAFERIKDMALHEIRTEDSSREGPVDLAENLRADYRMLFISSVSYGGSELGPKCLIFSIGGMLDNTVGFLYVSDKADLPEMNPTRVIMLREIGKGWYLYKTT